MRADVGRVAHLEAAVRSKVAIAIFRDRGTMLLIFVVFAEM